MKARDVAILRYEHIILEDVSSTKTGFLRVGAKSENHDNLARRRSSCGKVGQRWVKIIIDMDDIKEDNRHMTTPKTVRHLRRPLSRYAFCGVVLPAMVMVTAESSVAMTGQATCEECRKQKAAAVEKFAGRRFTNTAVGNYLYW